MADVEEKEKDLEPNDVEDSHESEPELKEPVDKNEPLEVPVNQPSRAEKKRARFREFEERTTKAEERAAAAERAAQEARELYQRQLQHPQSHQSQPQQSTLQTRLAQISAAKQRLHSHYQAVASQPGYKTDSEQHREFERQAEELENLRVAALVEDRAQKGQINEQDLIRKAQLQSYLAEHADITNDPTRFQWAYARWQQLRAEGKPDTKEMSDAVFDEARIKYGLQPKNRRGSRPDDATRRRLSGVSAQSAGGDQASATYRMTAMERKMATIKYDKLPPKEAYQKWANNEGKRILERRAGK
jgi:hypothetical protein